MSVKLTVSCLETVNPENLCYCSFLGLYMVVKKGKTNLDFTEARDSEWQWHQLGSMQVCTSLQTETTPAPNHSVFLQARCSFCHPTNSVKALKAL